MTKLTVDQFGTLTVDVSPSHLDLAMVPPVSWMLTGRLVWWKADELLSSGT